VATAGAGRTLAEARAPAIRPLPGGRVLLHGAASTDCGVPSDWAAGPRRPGVELTGLSERAGRELGARVAAIRRPGDIVVVSIHWGTNWGYQTPEPHRRFGHALIEAGDVAIVHGHSSHHPRPIEVYRGRLILYGCGDFINDYEGIRGYEEFRSELVAMYFADLERSGALRRLRLAPLRIRRLRLERPEPADVVWLAATLTEQSRPFGTTFEPTPDGMIEVGWSSATQG
ncbi:MAG: CapA family protein, partial [Rhodospirillaceae bacterium]